MNARINKVLIGTSAVTALIPALAMAETAAPSSSNGLGGVLNTVSSLISGVIPIILALAIVFFMWGVLQYVTKGKDASGQAEARNTMLWGIIAIAVMVSIWGLVGILQSTFGIGNSTAPQNLQFIPTVQNPQ